MNRDEFDVLVKRLEPFAEKYPRAYFARVVMLAVLGYAFWLVVLGGLASVLVGLGVLAVRFPNGANVKIGLVVGLVVIIFMAAILRSIRVRIDPPEGFEVHRGQSPELFALLDEVSRQMACPRFHHVLLTSEYNAMVVQTPRLGMLGWQRNFLILGLPLLQGLSPEQFRAVVAHEFAHLSGNHSRFACWIYRVRRSWEQVLERLLAERHLGTGLFLKFFQWYAPYFNAYTFVLARVNEYEADSWSARLAGAGITAQALCNVQTHARLIDETFWPGMMRLAGTQALPEIGAFHRLGDMLRTGVEPRSAQKWLHQALAAETSNADTHPCLRDRLRALGCLVPGDPGAQLQPPEPASNRADALLGGTLTACIRALEIRWENGVKEQWRERYLQAQKDRERLQELANTEATRRLTADEHCERARILLELEGDRVGVPHLERVLELTPDHAQANFLLGRVLLTDDDPSGVPRLEKALEQDPDAVRPAFDLLYRYHRRGGRPDRMRELEKRYDEHQETLRFAEGERQSAQINDTFLPHGLDGLQVEDLRAQLRGYTEIQRVHLVRKEVAFFPKKPFYVLVVELIGTGIDAGMGEQRFVDRLAENLRLPGQTLIFTPSGQMEPVSRVIRLERWTLFYEKTQTPSKAAAPPPLNPTRQSAA